MGVIPTTERRASGWTPGLTWSPDGRSLAFPDRIAPNESLGIFSLSIETGEKRRLTSGARDNLLPAFSPDGQTLALSATFGATEPRSVADKFSEVIDSTWSRREDLNLRPADYELCSEPTEGTQEDPPTTEIKDLDNK